MLKLLGEGSRATHAFQEVLVLVPAVTWAERALALGYAAQWFHYPWFERVRAESPRLRAQPPGAAAPPERDE